MNLRFVVMLDDLGFYVEDTEADRPGTIMAASGSGTYLNRYHARHKAEARCSELNDANDIKVWKEGIK